MATPHNPEHGDAFGSVLRGAAIPRAAIPLDELALIAALTILAFDNLDDPSQEAALTEARQHIAEVRQPRHPGGPPNSDGERLAELARHTRLSHLGAGVLADLEPATDAALDAGGIHPETGQPR